MLASGGRMFVGNSMAVTALRGVAAGAQIAQVSPLRMIEATIRQEQQACHDTLLMATPLKNILDE